MTPTQIKIIRISMIAMMGVTLYQAYIIGRLMRNLKVGKRQFDKLHEAADYLLEVIEKNEIELTEFDFIALSAISEGR